MTFDCASYEINKAYPFFIEICPANSLHIFVYSFMLRRFYEKLCSTEVNRSINMRYSSQEFLSSFIWIHLNSYFCLFIIVMLLVLLILRKFNIGNNILSIEQFTFPFLPSTNFHYSLQALQFVPHIIWNAWRIYLYKTRTNIVSHIVYYVIFVLRYAICVFHEKSARVKKKGSIQNYEINWVQNSGRYFIQWYNFSVVFCIIFSFNVCHFAFWFNIIQITTHFIFFIHFVFMWQKWVVYSTHVSRIWF